MIVDATNLIAGRIATVVAKKALLGEGIVILYANDAVISGHKRTLLEKTKKDYDRGIHTKGPFIPKLPEKYLKRIIRGMLPYKQPKGKAAFARIKCYNTVPEQFKDQKIETIPSANLKKLPTTKFITIKAICKNLGGKI